MKALALGLRPSWVYQSPPQIGDFCLGEKPLPKANSERKPLKIGKKGAQKVSIHFQGRAVTFRGGSRLGIAGSLQKSLGKSRNTRLITVTPLKIKMVHLKMEFENPSFSGSKFVSFRDFRV